jgi:hypothetical protein
MVAEISDETRKTLKAVFGFSASGGKNSEIADRAWAKIHSDPGLKRARGKLSIHEMRLIIGHVLAAM